jgi:D-amino-acid dehydrogenase
VPDEKDVWFGFRPCSPDGLPYIGVTKKYSNLAMATGHAMIGLGLAPATGKIIADAFNDGKPAIEVGLFDANRYS